MSNTPYFDAYERRRAWRNPTVTLNVYEALTSITDLNSRVSIGTGLHSSIVDTVATTSASISNQMYPKYRLHKTYTFINDVKILQDCELEIQETPSSNWRVVETPFCSYE